jgi:hypothetical protein
MTVLKTFVEFSNACSVVVYYLQMSHFLFCLNIQITTFKIGSRRCSKDSMVFFKEKLARFFQTHPLRVKKKKTSSTRRFVRFDQCFTVSQKRKKKCEQWVIFTLHRISWPISNAKNVVNNHLAHVFSSHKFSNKS